KPSLGGESYQWERSCIQTWATSFRGAACRRAGLPQGFRFAPKAPNERSELGATAQALGSGGTRGSNPGLAFSTIAGRFEGFIASSTTLLKCTEGANAGPD